MAATDMLKTKNRSQQFNNISTHGNLNDQVEDCYAANAINPDTNFVITQ